MALPLIPFVAGAVIGGLAAYLCKDKKLRNEIKKGASDASHKVSDGISGIRQRMSGKTAVSETAEGSESPEAESGVEKKVAVKKVIKKAARKKSVRKKAAKRSSTP